MKGKHTMKILIVVEGGVVQGIFTTREAEIYLVDHDNIKAGDSAEEARIPCVPDIIQTEEVFMRQLDSTLEEYELEKGENNP